MTVGNDASDAAMTPVKRALLEIRELRARLAQAEAERFEPIAIIGMGMRFPGGVSDAASFARLLWSGGDAIGDIPADRWSLDALYSDDPDAPGKMITRRGGFIDEIDRFDAEFFGISPREAASMDPQQRILLEVTWQALEDAGHAPASLTGSRSGVYLGICNNDYGRALFTRPDLLDIYASTGNAHSIAAGRLSYFLGWHGPSMAIDTACSSSLVALHLACQALRLGECDLAATGGINLILTPDMNICFSKARMMAADGRCKTFDVAADGYVRSEGCGMVVLRRLSDAVADGDRILAVVRGSAVNQDGRSGGLTAPSGPAQQDVIRAALAAARVAPNAIGYLEAHGTGTPLGDPIEIGAIGAVFGPERTAGEPLAVGSVKTNLGHLEGAAGIAGLMKIVLSLQRKEIPPHLHLETGNPHIDWAGLPITVPTAAVPFASNGGPRLAGVSSFGFSGCNAHVILEEGPPSATAAPSESERPLHVLALSTRDATSLNELVRRYHAALVDSVAPADACYTANAGRSHFNTRLAVAGATAEALRQGLGRFIDGTPDATVATGWHDGATRPQVAFLFTGQGAQYARMGMGLYATSPSFRQALDACAEGLAPHMARGLVDVLNDSSESAPINRTMYAQPALFAIEYSLAQLWRSWGVEPVAVLGHSLGEYAAACIAGILPLDDALRLVAERGRLTETLAGDGMMAAVFAREAVVAAEIAGSGRALTIAAHNGPEHFVVSGERETMAAMIQRLRDASIRVRPLYVSYAAHSPLVDPVLQAFRPVLETVRFRPNRIALVSNVTGGFADSDEVGRAEYWCTHMREPVRFARSIEALAAQGITHCIEVGPHPILLAMAAECVPDGRMRWLPSARLDRTDWSDLIESLQALYADGADIDWRGFDRDYQRRRVALPSYPFRRQRHWIDVPGAARPAPVTAAARWSRVSAATARQASQGPLDLQVASYPTKWACLERLTRAHAIQTLRDAGMFVQAGEAHTTEQVIAVAGIGAMYRHLVRHWLDGLAASGTLRADGARFVADRPLPVPDLAGLWAEAEDLLADNAPLLAYLKNCGGLLSDVLRGRQSPLETLFPQGSFELAEGLYQRSPSMRYFNDLVAAALGALAETIPAGQRLRIVEIGAGTGGTTASALTMLPTDRTQYVYTDVSDVFLDRGRDRFGQYPFVSYARFDMDRAPNEQGFAPASCDVIVAANAIHASVDLPLLLRRLRTLLAPGGLMILIESTTHFPWFDITTGLMGGWQHFADKLRQDSPLLRAGIWIEALQDAGFDAARAFPETGSPAEILGQHVLIARVAGEPSAETTANHPFPASDSTTGSQATPHVDASERLLASILEALPSERHDMVCDLVRDEVMRVLRCDSRNPPDRHDRLMDLGLDSLMAVQLRDRLGRRFGVASTLPVTLMFDHPTIDALASYLCDQLAAPEPPTATPSESARLIAAAQIATVAAMDDAQIEARLLARFGQRQPAEQAETIVGQD